MTSQKRPDRRVERLGHLLEPETADVTEMDDFAISLGKAIECLLKPSGLELAGIRLVGRFLAPRHDDERRLLGRDRLPPPPPHLVPKPVHRDPHQPRLEPTTLLVVGERSDHGAVRGLDDLLGEIVVTTLGTDDRVHPRRRSLDDLSPRVLVASGGPGDERGELLGVEIVHARRGV